MQNQNRNQDDRTWNPHQPTTHTGTRTTPATGTTEPNRPDHRRTRPTTHPVSNTPDTPIPQGNHSNVYNLTHHTLGLEEETLLQLGLNFIPTNNRVHINYIREAFNKLTRSLKLIDPFGPSTQQNIHLLIRCLFITKSDWTSPIKDITDHTKYLIN